MALGFHGSLQSLLASQCKSNEQIKPLLLWKAPLRSSDGNIHLLSYSMTVSLLRLMSPAGVPVLENIALRFIIYLLLSKEPVLYRCLTLQMSRQWLYSNIRTCFIERRLFPWSSHGSINWELWGCSWFGLDCLSIFLQLTACKQLHQDAPISPRWLRLIFVSPILTYLFLYIEVEE